MARCNVCHQQLATHGGSRQNIEFCVMCHNANGHDNRPVANGGPQSIEFQYLVHRIHMGASLPSVQAGGAWAIWSSATSPIGGSSDFSDVVFPQAVTNCAACHANNTQLNPQARVCTSCHDAPATIAHAQLNTTAAGVEACATCHGEGRDFAVSTSHPRGF
jgi:OmcA/MtrC family decaheme c-type cytochrome